MQNTISTQRRTYHAFFSVCVVFSLSSATVFAQTRPPALMGLEKQGVVIVGSLPSSGGLHAWAAYSGQHPIALYETPDGKHVIAGTMFDAAGKDVNHGALEKLVTKPMADVIWGQLEHSRWIADGSNKAPRTVYVFTDPNCPYCNKFWSDARPWVDAGKVQLRHIMVGILTPTSRGKAAALLNDKNPGKLLESYERNQVASTTKTLASGRPKALADNGLTPLADIPAPIQAQLESNEKLMHALGAQATPAIVWRDAQGKVQTQVGIPAELQDVFGPQ